MTPLKNGKNKACKWCGILFYVPQWNDATAKYCSGKCRGLSQRNDKTRKCKQCHNEFQYKYGNKNQIFCSSQCRTASLTNRTPKVCANCFTVFCVAPWENYRKFCNQTCAGIANCVASLTLTCAYCGITFEKKPHQIKIKNGNHFCSVKCLCRHNNMTGNSFRRRTNTKPEQFVKIILEELKMPFETGKKISYEESYKLYDIFIPSLNLLIEVDGVYWHGKGLKHTQMNKTQLHNNNNDMIKNKLANQNGYNLARIWEDEISVSKVMEVLCVQ